MIYPMISPPGSWKWPLWGGINIQFATSIHGCKRSQLEEPCMKSPNFRLVGGWAYPSEKWWTSSVGMMKFPTEWENKECSKPPTSNPTIHAMWLDAKASSPSDFCPFEARVLQGILHLNFRTQRANIWNFMGFRMGLYGIIWDYMGLYGFFTSF